MSAQAIKLASNKNAKDAIDKGTYLDPISNVITPSLTITRYSRVSKFK